MLLSILMPARDAGSTIVRALRSTLREAPPETEVIVVDDASEDDTRAAALSSRDPRVRVLELSERAGVAGALARGLAEARGEFLLRMDADDVSLPGRVPAQLRAARAGLDVVFTSVIHFGAGLRVPYPSPPVPFSDHAMRVALLHGNPVAHSTFLGRRSILNDIGGYRPVPAEDYDLWLRVAATDARMGRLGRPRVALRRHATQVTRTSWWRAEAAADLCWRESWTRLAARMTGVPEGASLVVDAAREGRQGSMCRALGSALSPALHRLDPMERVAIARLARRNA